MRIIASVLGTCTLSAFVLGCTSNPVKRGHVVMKSSERVAHVALPSNEVSVGDHVELYRNKCNIKGVAGGSGEGGFGAQVCEKIGTGHGVVTSVFGKDYVEVEFPVGTKFIEGDTVEKHSH